MLTIEEDESFFFLFLPSKKYTNRSFVKYRNIYIYIEEFEIFFFSLRQNTSIEYAYAFYYTCSMLLFVLFLFLLPLFSTTSSSTIFFYNYKRKEKKRKKNCSTKRRSRRSRRNNRRLFLTNSYAREDIDVRTYEEHMIDAHELDE